VVSTNGGVTSSLGVEEEPGDRALGTAVEPALSAFELTLKEGGSEAALLNRLHQGITLVQEILITGSLEILDEPEGVGPGAVGDPKDGAGRARDASLHKRTVDRFFGAVKALCDDHRTRLNQLQNPTIIDMKRRIGDVRKLAVAMGITRNNQGIVDRRNGWDNKAFGRGARRV